MSFLLRSMLCVGICLPVVSESKAQFGGGMIAPPSPAFKVVLAPKSAIAEAAKRALDVEVESLVVDTTLRDLGTTLTKELGIPFFVDTHGIAKAELDGDEAIKATINPMPLGSAMRQLLRPHALRVVVEAEGLVITADFRELTRRGIATDYWLKPTELAVAAITKKLDAKQSAVFKDIPLNEAVAVLAKQSGISMQVDRRALEELGLADDTPVQIEVEDISLKSILRLMLREMDLTYMIRDEILVITTIEACEGALVSRVYYMESTGFLGDFDSIMQAIQQTIVPDTWEALGGPSTMTPLTVGVGNRPSLVVSTTFDIHEQIENLIRVMRENHVGSDPDVQFSDTKSTVKPNMPSGGKM